MAEANNLQEQLAPTDIEGAITSSSKPGTVTLKPVVRNEGGGVYRLVRKKDNTPIKNTIHPSEKNLENYVYVLDKEASAKPEEVKEQKEESAEEQAQEAPTPEEVKEEKVEKLKEALKDDDVLRAKFEALSDIVDATVSIRGYFRDAFGINPENFASVVGLLREKHGDLVVNHASQHYVGAKIGAALAKSGVKVNSMRELLAVLSESSVGGTGVPDYFYAVRDAYQELGYSTSVATNLAKSFYNFITDANVMGIYSAMSLKNTTGGLFTALSLNQKLHGALEKLSKDETTYETFSDYADVLSKEKLQALHDALEVSEMASEEDEKIANKLREELSTEEEKGIEIQKGADEVYQEVSSKWKERIAKDIADTNITPNDLMVPKSILISGKDGVFSYESVSDAIKYSLYKPVLRTNDSEKIEQARIAAGRKLNEILSRPGIFESLLEDLSEDIEDSSSDKPYGEVLGMYIDSAFSRNNLFSDTTKGIAAAQRSLVKAGLLVFAKERNLPLGTEWDIKTINEAKEFIANYFSIEDAISDAVANSYSPKHMIEKAAKNIAAYELAKGSAVNILPFEDFSNVVSENYEASVEFKKEEEKILDTIADEVEEVVTNEEATIREEEGKEEKPEAPDEKTEEKPEEQPKEKPAEGKPKEEQEKETKAEEDLSPSDMIFGGKGLIDKFAEEEINEVSVLIPELDKKVILGRKEVDGDDVFTITDPESGKEIVINDENDAYLDLTYKLMQIPLADSETERLEAALDFVDTLKNAISPEKPLEEQILDMAEQSEESGEQAEQVEAENILDELVQDKGAEQETVTETSEPEKGAAPEQEAETESIENQESEEEAGQKEGVTTDITGEKVEEEAPEKEENFVDAVISKPYEAVKNYVTSKPDQAVAPVKSTFESLAGLHRGLGISPTVADAARLVAFTPVFDALKDAYKKKDVNSINAMFGNAKGKTIPVFWAEFDESGKPKYYAGKFNKKGTFSAPKEISPEKFVEAYRKLPELLSSNIVDAIDDATNSFMENPELKKKALEARNVLLQSDIAQASKEIEEAEKSPSPELLAAWRQGKTPLLNILMQAALPQDLPIHKPIEVGNGNFSIGDGKEYPSKESALRAFVKNLSQLEHKGELPKGTYKLFDKAYNLETLKSKELAEEGKLSYEEFEELRNRLLNRVTKDRMLKELQEKSPEEIGKEIADDIYLDIFDDTPPDTFDATLDAIEKMSPELANEIRSIVRDTVGKWDSEYQTYKIREESKKDAEDLSTKQAKAEISDKYNALFDRYVHNDRRPVKASTVYKRAKEFIDSLKDYGELGQVTLDKLKGILERGLGVELHSGISPDYYAALLTTYINELRKQKDKPPLPEIKKFQDIVAPILSNSAQKEKEKDSEEAKEVGLEEEPKDKETNVSEKEPEPVQEETTASKESNVEEVGDDKLKSAIQAVYDKYFSSDKVPTEGRVKQALRTQFKKAFGLGKKDNLSDEHAKLLANALGIEADSLDDLLTELAEEVINKYEAEKSKKLQEAAKKAAETASTGEEVVDNEYDVGDLRKGLAKMIEDLPIIPKALEDVIKEYGDDFSKWGAKEFSDLRTKLKNAFGNNTLGETLQQYFPEGFIVEPKKEEDEESESSLDDIEGPTEEDLENMEE